MSHVPAFCLALPLILPFTVPPRVVHPELSALARLEDESLAEMRAGGPIRAATDLSSTEREALTRAEAAAGDLDALRGGDISNEDLTTILLVLGIVALVLIIL